MLGLRRDEDNKPHRNHYVSGPSPSPAMLALVEAGLVVEARRPGFLPSDSRVFQATDEGRAAAIAFREATRPRLTRAQRRYRTWLSDSDLTDESFGDWLRRKHGRRAAAAGSA